MPDVVRRIDAAWAQPAFARHPARVAAVEDGGEVALVRQLAVEVQELLVGDGVLQAPVEVPGDEALVEMVDLLVGAVRRDLGAVAGIEQHALFIGANVIQEPVQAVQDIGRGGAVVQDDADLLGLEAALLQKRAHEEDVVDAPLEAVREIRVGVDADEEGAPLGCLFEDASRPEVARECARRQSARQLEPHPALRVRVVEVEDGIVVQDVVGLVEGRLDLGEVLRMDAQLGSEDVILAVEEVIPHARVEGLDAAGEAVADERVADLRAEGEEGGIRDAAGVPLEGVIAEERAQAVGADDVGLLGGDAVEHPGAELGPQPVIGRPLRDHPRRPADLVGNVHEATAARQKIADPMEDAALPQLGQRCQIRRPIERALLEEVVVEDEVERHLNAGRPALQVGGDGVSPGRHQQGIDVAVADAVHAQDG